MGLGEDLQLMNDGYFQKRNKANGSRKNKDIIQETCPI